MSALDSVRNYIAMRQAGAGSEDVLVSFFTTDGCLVDVDGNVHKGKDQLLTYYKNNQSTAYEVQQPQADSKGRFSIDFKVYKLFMYWPIRAHFEMSRDDPQLFSKITIERL